MSLEAETESCRCARLTSNFRAGLQHAPMHKTSLLSYSQNAGLHRAELVFPLATIPEGTIPQWHRAERTNHLSVSERRYQDHAVRGFGRFVWRGKTNQGKNRVVRGFSKGTQKPRPNLIWSSRNLFPRTSGKFQSRMSNGFWQGLKHSGMTHIHLEA